MRNRLSSCVSILSTCLFVLTSSHSYSCEDLPPITNKVNASWQKETLDKGHEYDFILLDTAAAITVFSLNALVASDHVLIPVMPEYQRHPDP